MKTQRQSNKDRTSTLVGLSQFFLTKDGGGILIAELIESYSFADPSDENIGKLRDELKTLRDAADFALRKLRNI